MLIEKLLIMKATNIEIRHSNIIFEAWDEIYNLDNNSSTYIPKSVKVPLNGYSENELVEIIDKYIVFDDSDNLAEVGSFETYFRANSFMLIPDEYVFDKNWIYSKSITGLLINIIQTQGKIVLQLQVDKKLGKSIIGIICNGIEFKDIQNLKQQIITVKDLIISRIDSKTFYVTKTIPAKLA